MPSASTNRRRLIAHLGLARSFAEFNLRISRADDFGSHKVKERLIMHASSTPTLHDIRAWCRSIGVVPSSMKAFWSFWRYHPLPTAHTHTMEYTIPSLQHPWLSKRLGESESIAKTSEAWCPPRRRGPRLGSHLLIYYWRVLNKTHRAVLAFWRHSTSLLPTFIVIAQSRQG